MSCRAPVLTTCGGDSGWCHCEVYRLSREKLIEEISILMQMLQERQEELASRPDEESENEESVDCDVEEEYLSE
jgi:hypothetical protein